MELSSLFFNQVYIQPAVDCSYSPELILNGVIMTNDFRSANHETVTLPKLDGIELTFFKQVYIQPAVDCSYSPEFVSNDSMTTNDFRSANHETVN